MSSFAVPDFAVKVRGLHIGADVKGRTLEVSCESSVDAAGSFSLRLSDPDLKLTDSDLFSAGNAVEVHLGYAGRVHPAMLGQITAVQPNIGNGSTLTVTGYDASHRMRHNAPGRMTYKGLNDSLIAAQIALENLLVPVVDSSHLPPRPSVQQTSSDWALLQELAARNGFHVFVHWDKLYFRLPRPQLHRVVLEWGKNLISFQPRLSTSGITGLQEVRGYDEQLAQAIVAIVPAITLGDDLTATFDRISKDFLQQLMTLGRRVLHGAPVTNVLEGMELAKAVLQRLLEGLFEGSGTCIGIPELHAGDQVEVRGVGRRFSGVYRLSRVKHTINDGGYQTSFEVSQQGDSTLLGMLRNKLVEEPSPVRQEPIYGVAIGKVENNIDPLLQGRVLLSFPHLSDANLSSWARIASPSTGIYFLPNVGEEVLVAFDRGDVNHPYVLGALWNGTTLAPEKNLDGVNRVRLISTPGGHKLQFNDAGANGRVLIHTSGGREILLDDTTGGEKITIRTGGASLTLSSSKIILHAEAIEITGTKSLAMSGPGVTAELKDGVMNVS